MSTAFDWVEVQRLGRRPEAEQHALVLAAAGIACRVVAYDGALVLLVPPHELDHARRQLRLYAEENARRPRPRPTATPPLTDGLDGALTYACVLVFLHSASARGAFGLDWWHAGMARAGEIHDGAWWQAVTALGLHGDLAHLGGNLLFGMLFGLMLAQLVGSGIAWLSILAAGTLGNLLNALLRAPEHAAVGASTAVFGALGLLVVLTWWRHGWTREIGLRRWLPLAGGVMLLAFLGIGGERTDVVAHFAGFALGAVLGIGLVLLEPRLPTGPRAQAGTAALAALLVALAWTVAHLHHLQMAG
jgi:rhomboid protease GluP